MMTRIDPNMAVSALKHRYGTFSNMVRTLGLDSELKEMMDRGEGPYGDDSAAGLTPEKAKRLVTMLKDHLPPEDLIELCVILSGIAAKPDGATDEPPPFAGRPTPGGKMDAPKFIDLEKRPAMDAAASGSFEAMFPGADRIGIGPCQGVSTAMGPLVHGRPV
jgi:hypothetical protein